MVKLLGSLQSKTQFFHRTKKDRALALIGVLVLVLVQFGLLVLLYDFSALAQAV